MIQILTYTYSRVRNRRTCTFINFWKLFPPVRPYSILYVYQFQSAEISVLRLLSSESKFVPFIDVFEKKVDLPKANMIGRSGVFYSFAKIE